MRSCSLCLDNRARGVSKLHGRRFAGGLAADRRATRLPPLVRAGLVHVQFESIHPCLDGNGRVGRLLIALLLEHWILLHAPLLYLSLHFKRRRPDYYRLLNEVRRTGDWEGWTRFFLEGVAEIAEESASTLNGSQRGQAARSRHP